MAMVKITLQYGRRFVCEWVTPGLFSPSSNK